MLPIPVVQETTLLVWSIRWILQPVCLCVSAATLRRPHDSDPLKTNLTRVQAHPDERHSDYDTYNKLWHRAQIRACGATDNKNKHCKKEKERRNGQAID